MACPHKTWTPNVCAHASQICTTWNVWNCDIGYPLKCYVSVFKFCLCTSFSVEYHNSSLFKPISNSGWRCLLPCGEDCRCVLLLSTLMFLYCFLSSCLVSMWLVDNVGWCSSLFYLCSERVTCASSHSPSECFSFVLCFNGGGSLSYFSHT